MSDTEQDYGSARVSFRASELQSGLEARIGTSPDAESMGTAAKRDLGRYYHLVSEGLRQLELSEPEALLICDALNGYAALEPRSAGYVWAEIDDAVELDGLDEKWGVEQPAVLVAKLRNASPCAQMAVLDAVERFWRESERPADEMVREVGLVGD